MSEVPKAHLKIPIEPVAASRPRVSRQGHAYYAEPYKSYKDNLKEKLRELWDGPAIVDPIKVALKIVCRRPGKSKLSHPKPDVDNYAKGVMDAMNGVVVLDDTLVVELSVTKQWTEANDVLGSLEITIM